MGCKQSIKEQLIVKINKSSDIGELDQIWSDVKKEYKGQQKQWKAVGKIRF